MVTLEQLNGSTTQVGDSVSRTTINHTPILYERVARTKRLIKKVKTTSFRLKTSHGQQAEQEALLRSNENVTWKTLVIRNDHCT